jgi:hypothetical protein
MKISQLRELVKEVMQEVNELNTTANVAGYQTPFAFSKNNKKNRATKYGEKLGYITVKRKKRPYSTKLIDYLNENTTGKI